MRFSRLLLIAIFLVASLAAPAAMAQPSEAGPLPGTQWRLTSYGIPGAETVVLPQSTITLEFPAANEVTGSGGCNGYGGRYGVEQANIVFTDIVSTLMACADPDVTQQEQAYLEALRSASSYALAGDGLTLWYDNEQQQLNFTTLNGDEGTLQNTLWQLQSYGEPGTEALVIPDSNVTLNFQPNNRVEGNGGCNGFGGSYTIGGSNITFTDIISTLMACSDPGVTQQEQTYLEALRSATRYERTGSQLTIWYADGQRRLNFTYIGHEADILEGSSWQMMSYGDPNAPTPVIADSSVTLNFETATGVEGNGGCNGYSGQYQTTAAGITFSEIIHTKLACADPAVTRQEQTFFEALQSAIVYEGFFDRLIIYYPGGQLNFPLAMNNATPVPPIDLPEPVTPVPPISGGCRNPWIVQFGDTLSTIARACTTTVAALLAANPAITNPSVIYVGQEITIPDNGTVPPLPLPQGCTTTYTVQPGDTPASIARTCHSSIEALLAANPQIVDPTQLEVGQVLTIPQNSAANAQIMVEQPSGAPGTVVNVAGSGFTPHVDLDIGFGRVASEYEIIGAARTTTDGSFRTTVTIPDYATANAQWVFVAVTSDGFEVISDVFNVTAS